MNNTFAISIMLLTAHLAMADTSLQCFAWENAGASTEINDVTLNYVKEQSMFFGESARYRYRVFVDGIKFLPAIEGKNKDNPASTDWMISGQETEALPLFKINGHLTTSPASRLGYEHFDSPDFASLACGIKIE